MFFFFFRYNFGHPSHRVLCLFGTNVLPFTCQICMYCPFKNIWALGFSYLWRCWKVSCWILYDWLYDGELVLLPLTYLLKRSRQAVFSESITFFILDANWETECLNLKPFFLILQGTCVAFFTVVGDLIPPFVSDFLNMPQDLPESKAKLRIVVMVVMAVCVILPMSLMRQLDSLSFICTASLVFYSGVTLYIMSTAKENVLSGNWSR